MPLVNQPPQITALAQIKSLSTQLLGQMKMVAKTQFDLVWNNKDKTAQEVLDMFGVEAGLAMDAHYDLQMLILSIDNTWVPLVPPLPYVRNEDGTIVVTYPAPEGENP